ncbi:MAG: lipid II flippase MurJ [PVC group bacterium]
MSGVRGRPLVWDTITTTWWGLIGRAAGFMIPFFIAAWFGISDDTDAFFFSYGVILFLANIFAPVVEYVIVPYIAEARRAGRDIGSLIGGVLGISGLGIAILEGALLSVIKPVLGLVTRFDQPTLQLAYQLLLETAPLIILLVWTGILSGTLNAYRKFAFPAVSPAFRAIVNLGIIFAFRNTLGVHAIALGYVVGEAGRMIILLGVIKKLKLIRLRFSFIPGPVLRDFFRKASYQTVAMIAIWLKPIIDRAMASWLGEGNVSLLYYADRLYIIPVTFICSGLMATTLSHWSTRFYESPRRTLKEDVNRGIRIVGVLTVVITVFLLLFYRPIARIAFERGAFDPAQVPEVQRIWFFYLLGLIPYIIARIYFQAHLVLMNTRFLMMYSFCLNGAGIGLNYLLMKRFGVAGIALATTVSYLFAAIGLGFYFYRKLTFSPDQ